jgi:hypothetical protein
MNRVRQNYLAIVAAALASFIFEAVWFSVFINTWLAGIGKTMQSMVAQGKAAGMNQWEQYGVALVCGLICATAISCVTQLTGAQTAVRGIKVAALLWFGFVFTSLATNMIFELRPMSLFLVYAGYGLINMTLMGGIVGGWKKKLPAGVAAEAKNRAAVAG